MRKTTSWAALLVLAAGCATTSTFDPSTRDGAVKASNAFGFDLYGRLRMGRENLICSPAGASIALTMASAGARGRTQSEMARVLHIDPARFDATHASFAALLNEVNGRDGRGGVVLSVATRLWGQKDLQFKTEFLSLLQDRYKAPLQVVDFLAGSGAAASAINQWASEQTHGRISRLINGDLDTQTRLVLTAAVYFKGKWQTPFYEGATHDAVFTTATGKVSVPMMARVGDLPYAHVPGVQLVELGYAGDLSMVVILPDAVDGLPAVERQLAQSYATWVQDMSEREVDLQLPRWGISSELPLEDELKAMGMELPFDRWEADLFGMVDPAALFSFPGLPRLYIGRVFQQAWVQNDEQGTEAATGTAVSAEQPISGIIRPPPIIFHADHPFVYLIRDRVSGLVLFIGRVGDPSRGKL